MSKPLIVTVPGWNSAGWYMKRFNIYAARQGVQIYNFGYGWMLFKTLRNGGIVQRLVDFINFYAKQQQATRIIGIGHSNGCEILWKAAQRCHQMNGLVLINAALDNDVIFPESLGFVHNWYSPSDWVVRLASWIPFNDWGRLGATPYQGVSAMVTDYNKEAEFGHCSGSHSDVFRVPALRDYFLPLMLNKARKAHRQLDAGHDGR